MTDLLGFVSDSTPFVRNLHDFVRWFFGFVSDSECFASIFTPNAATTLHLTPDSTKKLHCRDAVVDGVAFDGIEAGVFDQGN